MSELASSGARRRRWWIPPFALAVLLIVAVAAGNTLLASYAVLAVIQPLEVVFATLTLALCLLALAIWLATWRVNTQLRVLLVSPLVIFALCCGLTDALVIYIAPDREEFYRIQSTDGSGTVIVYGNLDDYQWELELRWGSGLTGRRWDLGSVSGGDSGLSPYPPRVTWLGPERIRVDELPNRFPVDIDLDDSSGRPHETL